jgi:thiol-disulfide isomerase/thioredoxin
MRRELILILTLLTAAPPGFGDILAKGDRLIPFSLKGVDDVTYTVFLDNGRLCLQADAVVDGRPATTKTHPAAVLIDFWATWCVPCRAAMPYMQQLFEKYGPKPGQAEGGLQLFGIALDQKGSRVVKPFYGKLKISYPMLADPPDTPAGPDVIQTTKDMAARYRVQEIPVVYLIDAAGVISHAHIGFKKEQIAELDAGIGALVNAKGGSE